jgi:hypothetical protein
MLDLERVNLATSLVASFFFTITHHLWNTGQFGSVTSYILRISCRQNSWCNCHCRHRCQKFCHLCSLVFLDLLIWRFVRTISIIRVTHQTPDFLSPRSLPSRHDVHRQTEKCWKEHHWIPRRDHSRTLQSRFDQEPDQRSERQSKSECFYLRAC